MIAVIEESLTF